MSVLCWSSSFYSHSKWRPLALNLVPNAVSSTKFYSECVSVLSYFFLRNHPRLSFQGTGPLFWARASLSLIIGLASVMNFVKILRMMFFG